MKYLFLATLLPLSAWAVDYSRCQVPMEVTLDADGRVTPSEWYEASTINTEGQRTTMTVRAKRDFGGMFGNEPRQVVIERDGEGRVLSITSGGNRPSDATIRQYRQMMSPGGWGAAASNFGQFSVPLRREGRTEMVAVNDLTDNDLQQIGVRDMRASELKSGVGEQNRSRRTQQAMGQIQQYASAHYPFSIPVGTSHQYTYVDGVCMPDTISAMNYSSLSDRVESITNYNRSDCQQVKAAWQRHESKVNECRGLDATLATEYQRLVSEGHIQPQQNFAGGMVGGYVGGMAGGYVGGGMGYNPYSGGGIGGGFMGSYASDRQRLEWQQSMCGMYETSWAQSGGGVLGGSSGGGASALGF